MPDDEAWRAALWKACRDNHLYVRHHEVQRSSVATLNRFRILFYAFVVLVGTVLTAFALSSENGLHIPG